LLFFEINFSLSKISVAVADKPGIRQMKVTILPIVPNNTPSII